MRREVDLIITVCIRDNSNPNISKDWLKMFDKYGISNTIKDYYHNKDNYK
jgi:hypothetical protein